MSPDAAYNHAEHDRRIANALLVGTVDAVDLQAGTASVKIDDDWTTASLPWIEHHASGRVRSWTPPMAGDQVTVLSPSGEPGQGLILRGLPSSANPLPSQAEAVTVLAQWSDGALDQYDAAAHARTISLPAGGAVTIKIGDKPAITLIDGVATILADTVALGGAGGQPVARKGDHVKIDSGSSAGLWPIVEGSAVVSAT